jgi:protoheme ferro-lyase
MEGFGMARNGVLIVATGEPASIEEIGPYLMAAGDQGRDGEAAKHLRRALLTIGGRSPLSRMAERVAAALERALSGLPPSPPMEDVEESLLPLAGAPSGRTTEPVEIPVRVGFLASEQSITSAMDALAEAGSERIVLLPLAPFDAPGLAGAARGVAAESAAHLGLDMVDAPDYGATIEFARAVADVSQPAIEEVFPEHRPVIVLVAPAPNAEGAGDCGAIRRIEQVAASIASQLGIGEPDSAGLEAALGIRGFGGPGSAAPWLLAYQPDPGEAGPAIGPSVSEVISAAEVAGLGGVALLPFAYTVNNMTVLYEMDVMAADAVLRADMEYSRAASLNDDPRFIAVLEGSVRAAL